MIWFFRIIFILGYLVILDLFIGLLGLLLSLFSLRRYPRLHRAGLRLLAMSDLLGRRALPRRCQLVCGVDKCRNKTCPGWKSYSEE